MLSPLFYGRIGFMELKKEIIRAVGKNLDLPHYKLFYFGSRVNGGADIRSDIDVGIEAPEEIPLEIISGIKTDLDDLPILQKIDFVDFGRVSEEFKKVALQNTKLIYEK